VKTGILLFAHGSPVEDANRGVHDLAERIKASGPHDFVRAAFLEDGRPDLATAVGEAVDAGIKRLVVVPYFLTTGLHLRRDLPRLIDAAKQKHPSIEILVGQSLEGHPLMPALLLGRISEVLG